MAKKKTNAEKLSDAYLKAYNRYTTMKKDGFVFDKRTEKMFSAESFQAKALKPTKKNIERYKAITKSALYKKAKGYYDINRNVMTTVKQGKQIVRKQKAEEKARKQAVSTKNKELFEKLNQINSKYFDIESQKNEVMNNYSEFVANGGAVSSGLISKIDEKIAVIIYDSKQDHVNDAFDAINSMLTNGESYSDGGSIDLVGTPYETA